MKQSLLAVLLLSALATLSAQAATPSKADILKLVGTTWSGDWNSSFADAKGPSQLTLQADGKVLYSYGPGIKIGFEGKMGPGGGVPSNPIVMNITLPDGNDVRFQWDSLDSVSAEFWEKGKKAGQTANNPAQAKAVLTRKGDAGSGASGGDASATEAKKVLNSETFEMNAFSVSGGGEGGGYYLAAETDNGGNLWIAKMDGPDAKKPNTVRLKIKTESMGSDTYGFRVLNAPKMPENSYLTVKDKTVTVTSQTAGQLAPEAQWVRVDAFAKGSTGSAFSSFQSKKEPTQYLRHAGYRVLIAPQKSDKTTREDESWELEPVK